MKSLLFVCCLLLSVQIAKADVARPKEPEKPTRILRTTLEIVPDAKAYASNQS